MKLQFWTLASSFFSHLKIPLDYKIHGWHQNIYCFQNFINLCNGFPFHLSFKISDKSFKNGSHLPFSELLNDFTKTSFSPPIVVDRHICPRVVQVVVGVALVRVLVVVHFLNRVLCCVRCADCWSVVICVGECHIGGRVWKKKISFRVILCCHCYLRCHHRS